MDDINAVREHFAPLRADFLAHLRGLESTNAWEHSNTPELAVLEAWATELAALDRRAAVATLVAAGGFGLRRGLARAGSDAYGMAF